MSTLQLKTVNREIYAYWTVIKTKVARSRLKKKVVGTFTRHNGNRIKALKDAWRYDNGIRSHDIKRPSIGYKRSKEHRFRRASDGLLFKTVHNSTQLCPWSLKKPYQVFVISSSVSARTRRQILEKAKLHQLPLYINRMIR